MQALFSPENNEDEASSEEAEVVESFEYMKAQMQSQQRQQPPFNDRTRALTFDPIDHISFSPRKEDNPDIGYDNLPSQPLGVATLFDGDSSADDDEEHTSDDSFFQEKYKPG